jgi:F-box/leucine-rich repeat protein 5
MKLRKALRDFIKDFVPHMKEEEEVFQPLLIEHFEEEELIEMKHLVIKLHLLQRKHHHSSESKINLKNDDENKIKTINSLPNEILLKIFKSLNQKELLCLAKVSRNWNVLSYDPLQWSSLSFTEWLNMSSIKKLI